MKGRSRRQPGRGESGKGKAAILAFTALVGLCALLLWLGLAKKPGSWQREKEIQQKKEETWQRERKIGQEEEETRQEEEETRQKEEETRQREEETRQKEERVGQEEMKIWSEGNEDRRREHGRNETGETTSKEETWRYQNFLGRIEAVKSRAEIEVNGFAIIEEQIYPLVTEGFGEIFLVPAMDPESRRLVLFFAEEDGKIIFSTERLETNRQFPGRYKQGTRGVAAVSFPDINGDGLSDVVLITICNTRQDGTGITCKVGDVLFQGEESFYQDWRLSDRINRLAMNKSVRQITSFSREGNSAEFLYQAESLKELREHGFVEETGYSFKKDFEKLGELSVVPGYYKMAEYHIFMVYLVNGQGNIVWSGQPMGEFENLYEILGIDSRDIDGDGLKDLTVLARYTYDTPSGEMMTEKDYTIYYQRTGGFQMDTELKSRYQCTEETTMEELVELARSYWGWGTGYD